MYLKNIEVQGFKSFAQKINFEFHNGITGIVGPNGSGKSNVGDAVRWVLGEQSAKQLRGGNMQDVIFSGTELRKPLSFASVAITLDNSDHKLPVDFEEVTVTRRLYRSGESEYRINGSSCRLKDINEMFYDTGIGKEGYSIIGQGQPEVLRKLRSGCLLPHPDTPYCFRLRSEALFHIPAVFGPRSWRKFLLYCYPPLLCPEAVQGWSLPVEG